MLVLLLVPPQGQIDDHRRGNKVRQIPPRQVFVPLPVGHIEIHVRVVVLAGQIDIDDSPIDVRLPNPQHGVVVQGPSLDGLRIQDQLLKGEVTRALNRAIRRAIEQFVDARRQSVMPLFQIDAVIDQLAQFHLGLEHILLQSLSGGVRRLGDLQHLLDHLE